jgi:hypothetical protein
MYACEMQICCYSNVKYSIGIKLHFYHLATILWGIFFYFSFANEKVFNKFYCCTIKEKIQTSNFVFLIQNLKGYVRKY